MSINVYILVQYYTIIYSGNGTVFGMALFVNNIHTITLYVKELYVAPPSVLF